MTEEESDDLDLSTLSDEELVEQMHDDLYDGLKEEDRKHTSELQSHSDLVCRLLLEKKKKQHHLLKKKKKKEIISTHAVQ